MQFIRDNRGAVIGQLQVLHNGIRRIYSVNPSKLLGWYDPNIDKTIDASTGSWMGFGDQTMMLLAKTV